MNLPLYVRRFRPLLMVLLIAGLVYISCFLYFQLIYPIIVRQSNERRAAAIEKTVEQVCSENIEVRPGSLNELTFWYGSYPISRNKTLYVECRENGSGWECECTYKETPP
jgi:hypothetical protein